MYKTVYVCFAEGFEEVEAVTVVDVLRRANINVLTISCDKKKVVEGSHGVKIVCDELLDNLDEVDIEDSFGVIIPGGMPGADNLKNSDGTRYMLQDMMDKGKLVAAICAGPIVLQEAGIIENKRVTSYPGFEKELIGAKYIEDSVVVDGNLITARGPAIAMDFALTIVEHLCGTETRYSLAKELLK